MRDYRERFFRSGPLRIHFRDWGQPDNPPVVIVHGLRDHSHSFDELSRELSRDYRVYAIDLRGHGDSESTPYYAFGHFVGDIRNMIRALRLENPVVIGHSLGGEIVAQGMRSIPEVMQKLTWSTPDGCSSCRPALNYYLLCALPGEYKDDQQSRFVNERLHANIQKDGTYSVVPRMWGGLTSPKELRAIADVVEKFDAPMVKVTGGQRLDIFGIKKEDLPAVWADLNAAGMVSGHAYGKSLRTVKTCVGSEWCRFGTQDSTGLGVKVERMTWGSWMPHKFKIAVSGCPRNCAEATIKDFGVVCVDSGYELHVGGNGGIKVRATDFLCKVATEEEAMHYCAAFIQLYREEARYLERTAPWIERIGVDYIRQRIADDAEGRDALAARFRYSQTFMQDDPWAARAAGDAREQHAPMAVFTPLDSAPVESWREMA